MALVLMRFRCVSKPNRVECASDAHWSCSHERQYLVDQLALPRLCTWLIDQRPSDTCLWSICHRCNPPVSPSFAPLTSTTTHTWHKTSLLLASLSREGFLSCDFLSTPTFYIGDSVWMRIETTSGGDFDQCEFNSLWMRIEIMRIHVNTTNAHWMRIRCASMPPCERALWLFICLFVYQSICTIVCLFVYQSICTIVYLSVCLPVYLYDCLFVCLFTSLFVWLFICLFVYQSICLFICLFVYQSIYMIVYLSVCLPVYLYDCLFVCLFTSLFVRLFICLFVY